MTDERAMQLLHLLVEYYERYGYTVDDRLTVHELVADLAESMSDGANTAAARVYCVDKIVNLTGAR